MHIRILYVLVLVSLVFTAWSAHSAIEARGAAVESASREQASLQKIVNWITQFDYTLHYVTTECGTRVGSDGIPTARGAAASQAEIDAWLTCFEIAMNPEISNQLKPPLP